MNAKQLESVVTRAADLEFDLFEREYMHRGGLPLSERDRMMFRVGFSAGAAYLARVNHETVDDE